MSSIDYLKGKGNVTNFKLIVVIMYMRLLFMSVSLSFIRLWWMCVILFQSLKENIFW
jgi:hypothetical protein